MKKFLRLIMSWSSSCIELQWSLNKVCQLMLAITLSMLTYDGNAQFYNGYKVSSNTHSAFFKSLNQVENGGYVVAGFTPNSIHLDHSAIMRFNDDGEAKWFNNYDLINARTLFTDVVTVQRFLEPEFIAVGNAGKDIFITRTSHEGILKSALTITTPGDREDYNNHITVRENTSGLAVISGITRYNPDDPAGYGADVYAIQIKGGIKMVRGRQYHNPALQQVEALKATADGGVVMVGSSETDNPCDKTNHGGVLVMKLDQFLNVEWSKVIKIASTQSYGNSVNVDSNGKIWVAGTTPQKGFLMSMLMDGTVNWVKGYSQSGWGIPLNVKSVHPYTTTTGADEVVLYGQMNFGGFLMPYVINTNDEGDLRWARSYQIAMNDMYPERLIRTKEGGFSFTGNFFDSDPQADNHLVGYLAVLDEEGDTKDCFEKIEMTTDKLEYCEANLEVIPYETFTQKKVIPVVTHFDFNIKKCTEYNTSNSKWEKENESSGISPNPVGDLLTLSEDINGGKVRIYNKQGDVALKVNTGVTTVDVSSLTPGLYVIKIEDRSGAIRTYSFIKK